MDPFLVQRRDYIRSELAKHPLNLAANEGEMETVLALIEAGESVNNAMANGWTVLHVAEFSNNLEMVECLVRLGADMALKDQMGMDPLFHAVTEGHSEMVRCLVGLGAELNTWDISGATSLHRVAHSNKLDMVRLLVELGVDVNVKEHRGKGQTPLQYAVGGGTVEMVELLVELGADVKQEEGVNGVAAAARDGRWDMVECLARHGADLDHEHVGMTAMTLAAERGFVDSIQMLIKYGAKVTGTWLWPLIFRCINNHDETTLAVLLDGGAQPDAERSFGMTPLYFTATLDNGSAASLLINAGADVNFTTGFGQTPLHGSCMHGHTDLARLLLLAGADVNKADLFGKRPLDYLPFQDLVDYSRENRWRTTETLIKSASLDVTPDVTCPPLEKLHMIPGLGNVLAIPGGLAARIFTDVKGVVEKLPTLAGNMFIGAQPQQVGSSGEGTRTGLPNEMDFIFQVDLGLDNRAVQEVGCGYAFFSYPVDAQKAYAFVQGSKSFHDIFTDLFGRFNTMSEGSKITLMEQQQERIKDTDRKACTPMMLCWEDDGGKDKVGVSVDAVPCIHINDWPEKGTRGTWLMDYATLKERGYNLIPKSPNVKSAMARGLSPKDLKRMWRISFSHLETEHMYNVIPRVKAVYVTAKCLRNPDVCQILIRDTGTRLKTAESYVVSYLLKMMFFQRVEEFQQTEQSLGEMVCQLFDDVLEGLTSNFIPLFFIPSINVLEGLKLDVNKCAAVTRIMCRFVKALYARDLETDASDVTEDADFSVYKRDDSLYKVYDISNIETLTAKGDLAVPELRIDGAACSIEDSADKEKDAVSFESIFTSMLGALQQIGINSGTSSLEDVYLSENMLRDTQRLEQLVKALKESK